MSVGPAILFFAAAASLSSNPDLACSGPDSWAAGSTYAQLKNAGLLTPDSVDFSKTRVELLAQQRIGKNLSRDFVHVKVWLNCSSRKHQQRLYRGVLHE